MNASPLIVLERAVLLHRILDAAGVPHAIGGALALAYHVSEVRATRDIDLNVAADPADPAALFELFPAEVPWSDRDVARVRTDGQVRLHWPHPDGQPAIPLDLFFPQSPFHLLVNERSQLVPMLDDLVPIVSATDLTVFKVLFDRRKDWADIEELLRYGCVDVAEVRRQVVTVVGADDRRLQVFAEVLDEVTGTGSGDRP